MSKYQEALKRIIEIKHLTSRKEQIQYCNLLQELVEKETPMKPAQHIHSKTKKVYYECRGCGIAGITKAHNYCSECGQKLDWSDSE